MFQFACLNFGIYGCVPARISYLSDFIGCLEPNAPFAANFMYVLMVQAFEATELRMTQKS